MNVAQAKQIPLRELLASLGHQPVKERRGELWYLSPFRQESEPSFKINEARNIWYDFGEGEGGSVLEFAMRYYQVSSIAEALGRLSQIEPARSPTKARHPAQAPPSLDTEADASGTAGSTIQVTKVQHLTNRALIDYLASRGISLQTARPHLQEIYYTRAGKSYFALAFPNRSGGYEMRNPYYKGTHGVKDLSMLGSWAGAGEIAVFEGFMDYLSAFTSTYSQARCLL